MTQIYYKRLLTFKAPLVGMIMLMMAQLLSACIPIAIGTATVTAVDLFLERRTIGRNIDDNTLELKLRKQYLSDDRFGSTTNISVTAINGIILLTGEVPNDDQRRYAEQQARKYVETREVVNELELSGKTNLNSRANDSYLTAKVKSKLLSADGVPSSNIKVVTEKGQVYLLGLVTQAEAEAAVAATQSVRGVTHIVKVFEYINS